MFTLPTLLGIREIRPAVIFRREMSEARPDWLKRWSRSRQAIATAAAILVGIGLIAAWLAGTTLRDSLRIGAYFAGGLVVSLLVIAAAAWLLLRGLRLLMRGSGRALPAALRQGIANLYRPGNHAQTVLVTLGTGVMFTLTVYLVQHAVIADMMQNAPPGMPNVFLLDIPAAQRQSLTDLLKRQKGIENRAGDSVIGGGAAHICEWRADREFGLAGIRPPLPAHPLGDQRGRSVRARRRFSAAHGGKAAPPRRKSVPPKRPPASCI